jgi:hypothetical protein
MMADAVALPLKQYIILTPDIAVLELPPKVTAEEARASRNKKYPKGTDFRGLKLVHADFRGATIVQCLFDDADCKYACFDSANAWGSSFVGTNMHRASIANACFENADFRPRDCFGLTLSLHCRTFQGWKVDHDMMKLWFFMPVTWQLPEVKGAPGWWKQKIVAVLGQERVDKLKMVFDVRQV